MDFVVSYCFQTFSGVCVTFDLYMQSSYSVDKNCSYLHFKEVNIISTDC